MGVFPPLDPPVEAVVDEEVAEFDEQPARIKAAPTLTALSTRTRRPRRNPVDRPSPVGLRLESPVWRDVVVLIHPPH
jgi:hypothetical protein